MKSKLLTILTVLIIGSSSCISNDDSEIVCTSELVYGLNITLKDAVTDAVITEDVTVKITEGTFEETLSLDISNTFFGAGERPGTYTIMVTSPNYQTYTSDPVEVFNNQCHVITKTLEIVLQPN